ncbi:MULTISPECIES: hypothetical protein [Candidatus Ichthyocystis]|uniref:Uncharacterized protein n=1 Tax=Candidatus Ichthyocystis hellenicum TaxID=1561003 RepID=A0A0S4M4P2_9BURK|nr:MULTISPECIES: hypothetical protein [Ichthyocystis]CUT17690.1 hypothetical protein Ark11_0867 [Candidatus Ichthyocystis hellenicum]
MHDINHYGYEYGTSQDDSSVLSVETNLAQVSVTTDLSCFTAANNSFLSHQLPRNFYVDYGYSIDIEEVSENYGDNFLREYAAKCGYRFTEDFLSAMEKHRMNFIDKVDPILVFLSDVFPRFPKELECSNENIIYVMDLINKTRDCFSERVCHLMNKCIDVLRSDIVPITIRSIFNCNVIDCNSQRKMTNSEMELLFLHFFSILEKSVLLRAVKYWRCFCDDNKSVLSFISDVYYSDRFILEHHHNRIIPHINCQSVFICRFGAYISFISAAKIDEMMVGFIDRFSKSFKKNIRYKCHRICNLSDEVFSNIGELREKFFDLVAEEFDKKIMKDSDICVFSDFLNDILIWDNDKWLENSEKSSVFESIVDYMRNFWVTTATTDAYNIVISFQEKLSLEGRLIGDKCLPTVGDKWRSRIHPDDDRKIFSIRRKFKAKSKEIIKDKFCAMIKEEYKFSDGTTIVDGDWGKISKNLLPIAQESVRHLVDEECVELSKFLFNVRILGDSCVSEFDESFVSTRRASSKEIRNILEIVVNYLHRKNRNLFHKTWKFLIKNMEINSLNSIDSGNEKRSFIDRIDPILDTTLAHSVDGESSCSLVKLEAPVVVSMPIDFLGRRDKIVNTWGLSLHPYDDKLVFFIRKKFSVKISNHLRGLFYGMLLKKTELPSGKALCNHTWGDVSSELYPIAVKSIEPIIKEQCSELLVVFSKSRVIDANMDDEFSCIIRRVTDDEKNSLMLRADVCTNSSLMCAARSAWVSVTGTSKSHVFKETLGVKLRYVDNVDILNARKKYSSKIKSKIYDKFREMIKSNHKFEDGTTIGNFSWATMSKKLLPIVRDEIKNIIDDQTNEIEKNISKARVVLDFGGDREITGKEKSVVLEHLDRLMYVALKTLSRRVWHSLVISLKDNFTDKDSLVADDSDVNCTDNLIDVINSTEVKLGNKDCDVRIKLCYKDDLAILNIRKRFSSEIYSYASDKFSEMIKERYKFDDGTRAGVYRWERVSKNILPIIKKGIEPIIERERIKIREMLSVSRLNVSSPDNSSGATTMTRELTPLERSIALDTTMKCVHRQVFRNFCRIWNVAVKLSSVGLSYLREVDKSEIDNIRLEFIDSLRSVVDEVINSLLSDTDKSSSTLDYMCPDLHSILSKRSYNLFKVGGFSNRLILLLSNAQLAYPSENGRFITYEERKSMLEEFMGVIVIERDYLVKEAIGKYKNTSVFGLPT